MGDAADDAFDAFWEWDNDIQTVVHALGRGCERCMGNPPVEWNDEGLIECSRCKKVTDI